MKPAYVLLAAAAALASSACDGTKSDTSPTANTAPVEAIAPPEGGDWTQIVRATPEGGFVMGNPNADVKVVEFASMTCPHCAEFAENGAQPLVDKYVKTGRVSFEIRNYVRDGLDMAMALVARCGGPERFFPITDALFKSQRDFFQQVGQSSAQSPQEFAKLAGLQQWAAQRGLPSARSSACLANQQEAERLVQMSTDAQTQYPEFRGTPSFTLNGELLENTAAWGELEPKIRDAIG